MKCQSLCHLHKRAHASQFHEALVLSAAGKPHAGSFAQPTPEGLLMILHIPELHLLTPEDHYCESYTVKTHS